MKEVKLEKMEEGLDVLAAVSQQERVLITRGGKPVAFLVGIENKDMEDLQLEQSREFWQMIAERRKEPTIPFERLEAELALGNLPLCRYSMVIKWSDEDKGFVATLPEFGGQKAHGDSYEEAAISGEALLYQLMDTYEAEGRPLPEPDKVGSPLPA